MRRRGAIRLGGARPGVARHRAPVLAFQLSTKTKGRESGRERGRKRKDNREARDESFMLVLVSVRSIRSLGRCPPLYDIMYNTGRRDERFLKSEPKTTTTTSHSLFLERLSSQLQI